MQAQNPIPSYNVLVNGVEDFQEELQGTQEAGSSKGKRLLKTTVKRSSGKSSCEASALVYSLDKRDVLGPYTVNCEETLSVEIDERTWGVLVQSDDHVYVDVWIEEENPLKEE